MDDLISRQAAIDALDKRMEQTLEQTLVTGFLKLRHDLLVGIPSAQRDTVKVVRCKDCKHHDGEKPGMVYCPHIIEGWISEYFFCAGGERREDGL